jgi:hypothetical protein
MSQGFKTIWIDEIRSVSGLIGRENIQGKECDRQQQLYKMDTSVAVL